MAKTITIQATIKAPIEEVWNLYTQPEHVTKWNNASEDWHTPHAKNDLKVGGKFVYRMEAKDGSVGFDFSGKYEGIKKNEIISYTLDDDRKVIITFTKRPKETDVKVVFEAEKENTIELQQNGWQSILDNFKRYAEK